MIGLKKKITVGVSDARVSCSPHETIVTHSLGSCIGVCLYDPRQKIGGMLHFQLPDSKLNEQKALNQPNMFANTGLANLLEQMKALGSRGKGLQVKIAGGAAMKNAPANFEIGKRNGLAIRKALWKTGLMISAADIGGEIARTLHLDIETGRVSVVTAGNTREL